jgi:archaellum component FlaC
MDFYYDESQMNKWRDSCVRGQESLKNKVERFEKEIAGMRSKYGTTQATGNMVEESKCRELQGRLEAIVSEKEPLIISIISTVYEDLKEIHKKLSVFCSPDPSGEEVRQA